MDDVLLKSIDELGYAAKEIIRKHIESYYGEYTPKKYRRVKEFLNSIVKTDISKVGNKFVCTIFIDYENMHYKHMGLYNGTWQIVQWANEGIHGNVDINGKHFWDNAMVEIKNEEIIKNFVRWLEHYSGTKAERR